MIDPLTLTWTIAFIVGACVGSFLNVVIHRLPMGRSLVFPNSHCPRCGSAIRPYDNVPLFGWVWLFGLCRDCGVVIPARYPLVELGTALATTAVIARYGVTIEGGVYLVLSWGLIALTFIDLDYQIIPDELSLGGLALALLVAPFLPHGLDGALIGAVVGGGVFFLIAALYPGGMGGGDIKLMAAIGAFLGWGGAFLTIMAASISGALVGGIAMSVAGKGRKSKIPFGPFLAAGAFLSIMAGQEIIGWYFDSFLV